MTAPCQSCTRPITDAAFLCLRCSQHLERDLGDLPALDEQLSTTRLGQAKTGPASVGWITGSHDTALPFSAHAADRQDELRVTLVAWCRVVSDHRDRPLPADTVAAMSRYLMTAVDEHDGVRRQPWAADMAAEVGDARRRGWAAVDTAKDSAQFLLGPCIEVDQAGTVCPGELWVAVGRDGAESRIRCNNDDCGALFVPAQWMRLGQRIVGEREAS